MSTKNPVSIEDQATGKVLKALRAAEGIKQGKSRLSQDDIIKKLSRGSWDWSREELSRLETGKVRPTEQALARICSIYEIDRNEFQRLVNEEISALKARLELTSVETPLAQYEHEAGDVKQKTAQTILAEQIPERSVGTEHDIRREHDVSPLSNIEDQPLTDLVRGREEDLNWLRRTLFPDGNFAEGKRVAITGVGGMGKSTVALEYARRNARHYTYRFFCRASSQTSLTNSFLAMAERLKETDAEIRRFVEADRSTKEYITNVLLSVRNWLQQKTDYLLILDNADLIPSAARQKLANQESDLETAEWLAGKDLLTETELERFLPNPSFLRGHLLITSRNSITSDIFGSVATRQLEELSSDAGEVFLLERTQKGEKSSLSMQEQAALKQLVEHLHGLSLALEQAGAYIREKSQFFSTYLSNYLAMPTGGFEDIEAAGQTRPSEEEQGLKQAEKEIEVLERQKPRLGKYASTVAKTWLISFGAVKAESEAAAEAFTLSAFLDPDAAPVELLKNASIVELEGRKSLPHLSAFFEGAIDPAQVADRCDTLFQPLLRYSLVKMNADPMQTFKIHRMVQAVRRRTLTESDWQIYFQTGVEAVAYAFL